MILISVLVIGLVVYLVYATWQESNELDEHNKRVMSILNKAIDNVHLFFIGIFTGLYDWFDGRDDDDINE